MESKWSRLIMFPSITNMDMVRNPASTCLGSTAIADHNDDDDDDPHSLTHLRERERERGDLERERGLRRA